MELYKNMYAVGDKLVPDVPAERLYNSPFVLIDVSTAISAISQVNI